MHPLVRNAREFSSPEALKEYLHEHPNADRSKHHVKKDDGGHGGGHGDHEEKPKSLKERLKSLSEKAQSFVKSAPKEVSKFLSDDAHRRKVLTSASSALEKAPEKLVKNVINTVKHEVHEFKEAGAGIKAVMSGKKMDSHQKKALKTVAFHVGLTVAATALTASGPLAGMAMFGKSMAKHIAMKAASNSLGHLHVLEELGHVGHGVKHVLDKLAAEEKANEEEVLVKFVMALMAKELSKLSDDDIASIVEEASKGEKKEAKSLRYPMSTLRDFQDAIITQRLVQAVRKRRSEDDDFGKDEKKGEWNLMVRKSRPSRWDYFLKNPEGGGSGSNSFPSQKAAIAAAIGRGVSDKMGKDKVWVVIQEWDADAEEYKTKKSYWMDFPVSAERTTRLAVRVASRFKDCSLRGDKQAARWENAINGTYFTLSWNKKTWQIEESDEPISGLRSITEARDLDTYQMPMVDDMIQKALGPSVSVGQSTVRQYAKLQADDKGPETRAKLVKGYETVFDAIIRDMKSDGDEDRAKKFEDLVPALKKKLVWKKTKSKG
jgi:phenylpyruvate tautomerase PptA (4-oxalocrotonate tautomerase family)